MSTIAIEIALVAVVGVPALARAAEFRALWADAFHTGFRTASQTSQLVADARRGNFNAIVVQVRKRGDAFYDSRFEPKAVEVSPQSYDPLADLIAKAHAGSPPIEVHAWIVTYNIWNRESALPSQADHPFLRHRDWVTQNGAGQSFDGYNYAFDPAHPEVQQHTYDVAMDIVGRYGVDGLHFDYIRYSESETSRDLNPWGYHPVAVERFNRIAGRTGRPNPGDPAWLQFRRDQVTALVRKVYLNAWALRPECRISAATITFGSPPSGTSAGAFQSTAAYSQVLQDWRGWMREGILDLNIPMNYKNEATHGGDYRTWIRRIADMQFGRASAVGAGGFLNTTPDTITQFRATRASSPSGNQLVGTVGYSYAVPNDDGVPRSQFLDALTGPSAYDAVEPAVFADPEITPSMPWKEDPAAGNLMGTASHPETGQPLDAATVVLTRDDGLAIRALTTDATGFFGAVGLTPGIYTVTLRADGVPDAQRTAVVEGAAVAQVDFGTGGPPPFAITGIGYAASLGAWEVTWPVRAGHRYTVQVRDDGASTWRALASGLEPPAGGEATMTYRDFTATLERSRFYRVVESEPASP